MAEPSGVKSAPTLGGTLRNLLVSGVRVSAGFALYGLERVQNVVDAARGDGLTGAAEKLGAALDTLSDSLEDGMDETKKEALRSVSRVTAKAAEKYAELLSPEAILRAVNGIVDKNAAEGRRNTSAPGISPQLAGDVLTGPRDA